MRGRGDRASRRRSVYRPYVAFGFIIALLGAAVRLAIGDPFLLFPVAIFLGLPAALVWRFGGLTAIASVLGGAIAIGAGVEEAAIAWRAFDAYPIFVPVVGVVLGGLLTAVGSVAILVERFGNRLRTGPSKVERWTPPGVAVIALAVAVASVLVSVTSDHEISLRERAGATQLSMADTKFTPPVIEVSRAEAARVLLVNPDDATHTFTFDDLPIDIITPPRREKIVRVEVERAGRYPFYCRVSGHGDQTGTLIVR